MDDTELLAQLRPVSIHVNYHPEKLPRMQDLLARYHGSALTLTLTLTLTLAGPLRPLPRQYPNPNLNPNPNPDPNPNPNPHATQPVPGRPGVASRSR